MYESIAFLAETVAYNSLAPSSAITLRRLGLVACTPQMIGSAATESQRSIIMFSSTMTYVSAPLPHARGVYNRYRGALPRHWKVEANMVNVT